MCELKMHGGLKEFCCSEMLCAKLQSVQNNDEARCISDFHWENATRQDLQNGRSASQFYGKNITVSSNQSCTEQLIPNNLNSVSIQQIKITD